MKRDDAGRDPGVAASTGTGERKTVTMGELHGTEERLSESGDSDWEVLAYDDYGAGATRPVPDFAAKDPCGVPGTKEAAADVSAPGAAFAESSSVLKQRAGLVSSGLKENDRKRTATVVGSGVNATTTRRGGEAGATGGSKRFACHQCNYKYMHKRSMLRHQHNEHRGARGFKCAIGGSRFFERSTLRILVAAVHENRRDYGCSMYNKTSDHRH